jgi:hypothetical protein
MQKRLAAPFLVTIAACGNATEVEPHTQTHNPPPTRVSPDPTASAGASASAASIPKAPREPTSAGVKSRTASTRAISASARLAAGQAGACSFEESVTCPPGATCNPPPPLDVDCEGKGGASAGQFHLPNSFFASEWGCTYQSDAICPTPAAGGGSCSEQVLLTLDCSMDKTAPKPRKIKIPAFSYPTAKGECFSVPAFECEEKKCALPAPTKVACAP